MDDNTGATLYIPSEQLMGAAPVVSNYDCSSPSGHHHGHHAGARHLKGHHHASQAPAFGICSFDVAAWQVADADLMVAAATPTKHVALHAGADASREVQLSWSVPSGGAACPAQPPQALVIATAKAGASTGLPPVYNCTIYSSPATTWGRGAGQVKRAAYNTASPTHFWKAYVTGLTSDVAYTYSFTGVPCSDCSFATVAPTKRVRLAVVGDMNLGNANNAGIEQAAKVGESPFATETQSLSTQGCQDAFLQSCPMQWASESLSVLWLL